MKILNRLLYILKLIGSLIIGILSAMIILLIILPIFGIRWIITGKVFYSTMSWWLDKIEYFNDTINQSD